MRSRPLPWIAATALSLVGCGGGGAEVAVEDLQIAACDQADPPPAEVLLLTAEAGAIAVSHRAFPANCCADPWPRAREDRDATGADGASVVVVEYLEAGEPCDCTCPADLTYTLVGLPAGVWQVEVGTHATVIRVP